jgi:hypothetical protein
MHPDHERYAKACEYPGALDAKAVEGYLAEYLKALGVKREIQRLPAGWSLEKFPPLKKFVESVIAEFTKRSPKDALAARAAQAAQDARAALAARAAQDALDPFAALHRFASWCIQSYGYYWRFELSWLVTTWMGAKTPEVKAWSKPLLESYINGAWILHWTETTLYWVAKPRVYVERPNATIRRLHNETGPALESDVENLYFWHGVLVPAFVVTRPEWITMKHIQTETNLEVQRIMIERYGAGRYLKDTEAKLIDMDSLTLEGSAPRALMEDKTGNRWLCGTDGSTARVYTMAVPREAQTCAEAHRMISGLDKESRLVAEA